MSLPPTTSILHDLDTREAQRRGTFSMLVRSLGTALAHPSAWLLGWLLVTLPAALAVLGPWGATDARLAHHPGAQLLLDGALDADLARHEPGTAIPMLGATVFACLAFAWLSGGVLACVGRLHGFRLSVLFAEGGQYFLRNLRALLVGGCAALLVFWGVDVLDGWVRSEWLYETDPSEALAGSRWLSVDVGVEAIRYGAGLLFLWLAFVTKLAMARMVLLQRTGALSAWCHALLHALRHPLRTMFFVFSIGLLWLGLGHAIGMATAAALERHGSLVLGLLCGQLGILASQVLIVATLIVARTSIAASLPAPDVEPADFSGYPDDYFEDTEES